MVDNTLEVPVVNIPKAGSIVPAAALLLLQVPPVVASASVIDELIHTGTLPVIAAGAPITLNVVLILHVVGRV